MKIIDILVDMSFIIDYFCNVNELWLLINKEIIFSRVVAFALRDRVMTGFSFVI